MLQSFFQQSRAKGRKGKVVSGVPYEHVLPTICFIGFLMLLLLYCTVQSATTGQRIKIRFDEKLLKIYTLCNSMSSVYFSSTNLLGKPGYFAVVPIPYLSTNSRQLKGKSHETVFFYLQYYIIKIVQDQDQLLEDAVANNSRR